MPLLCLIATIFHKNLISFQDYIYLPFSHNFVLTETAFSSSLSVVRILFTPNDQNGVINYYQLCANEHRTLF